MPDETVNDPGTESLRGRVTRGVLWTGGGQVSGQALHWAAVLVLAWFVTPEAFGVVGFGVTCVSVLGALSEFGLGSALIQRADLEDAHVSASFWLSMTAATVLGALMWAAAGLLAAVVHDPTAVPVLRALAPVIPASTLLLVPRIMLARRLDFKRPAVADLASEVAFTALAIGMAARGFGAWSLVCGIVARPTVRAALLWGPWRSLPLRRFGWRHCREVLSFSSFVMGHQMTTVFMANVDNLVVGRFLGTAALGQYTLAFQLGVVPGQRLCEVLGRVAFPSFAAVQRDADRLRRGFLRMMHVSFLVAGPLAFFVPLTARPLIHAVYGPQWLPAAAALQVLSAAALFYAIDNSGLVLTAVGRPGWDFALAALRASAFLVVVAACGVAHGIVGVAASLLVATALSAIAKVVLLDAVVHVAWRDLLRAVAPALRAGTIAAATGLMVARWSGSGQPWQVAWTVGSMGLVYLALIARDSFVWSASIPRPLGGHRGPMWGAR